MMRAAGVGRYQVVVTRSGAYPDTEVTRVLNAQPETERVVGATGRNVTVPGIGDPVNMQLYRGDVSRLGYFLVAGRWFGAPGEVVAPRATLDQAHLRVGDSFTGTAEGRPLRLHVVGEVFNVNNLGISLWTGLDTYSPVRSDVSPASYLITLRPGSDVNAYLRRVAAAQPDFIDAQPTDTSTIGPVKIIDSVLLVIAAVLCLIGIAGVFNTLLLNTRERIRDTAILKAVGMTPRQVVVMVAASAGVLALIGGGLAVPIGLGLHRVLLDAVSSATGNDTPTGIYSVFNPGELAIIPLIAVAVAIIAALIPARWAADTNVVQVLHSE